MQPVWISENFDPTGSNLRTRSSPLGSPIPEAIQGQPHLAAAPPPSTSRTSLGLQICSTTPPFGRNACVM